MRIHARAGAGVVASVVLLSTATAYAADEPSAKSAAAKATPGVVVDSPKAFPGYTLIFPLLSTKTYLVDMQGRLVRTWDSKYAPGQEAYLLENGHLLRPAKLQEGEALFAGAGGGGRVQEFTWEGQLVWDYLFHNEKQIQHHAICRMPNGNVLMLVWERKSAKQAIQAGARPDLAGTGESLVDAVYEIAPVGKTGGKVVWQWHVWDHLVQDQDKSKDNYGDVAAHPERIDVNFARDPQGFLANFARSQNAARKKDQPKGVKNDALDKLKGIGYIGAGGGKRFAGFFPDWTHVNSVAYHAKLDQILLSSREFSEIWVIDHSTTTAEAAGHAGGRGGKGGDLLYRWGNPRAYRAGTKADQKLFHQHDVHWITEGLPGAGHILLFNNGGWPERGFSSVDEIVPLMDGQGRYAHEPEKRFGPDKALWSYTGPNKKEFFAAFMSGAQRLPNGNTLIATGFGGTIIEVTPASEIVWKYIVPVDSASSLANFGFAADGPPSEGGASKSKDANVKKASGGAKTLFGTGPAAAAFFGPIEGNAIFRAYRYASTYPGLAERELKAGKSIEE
jgi:hypothetical protein